MEFVSMNDRMYLSSYLFDPERFVSYVCEAHAVQFGTRYVEYLRPCVQYSLSGGNSMYEVLQALHKYGWLVLYSPGACAMEWVYGKNDLPHLTNAPRKKKITNESVDVYRPRTLLFE
jgi:pyruvate/2-oxoacid:ferredoxin oxidoreductase beta subunit